MGNHRVLSWLSRTTIAFAATLAACAGSTGDSTAHRAPATPVDPNNPFADLEQNLTALATQCTFNTSTGLMTVTLAADEVAIISKRGSDSAILQNGQACDHPVTAATVKKISVTGSTGDEKVILDFTNGLFATGTSSASSSGIVVDMGAGTGDKLIVKGTSGDDSFVYGASGILLNSDANKDITVTNAESYAVSLGDGNDTFSAGGGGAAGAVFGTTLTVYGGNGNDTFNQGAASTPGEVIWGGPGTDTVTYASRSAAVTVTVGNAADDGASGENDDLNSDVEVVTGGSGNDTLTAAAGVAITLNGGPGDDTLIGDSGADTLNGGAGNDTLRGAGGADVLNGDDGDDTFDEESASNGGDTMNGGNGIDTVDYSARTNDLTVTMDGAAANDGESGEHDNVKADVENIKCGSGNDNVTGNDLDNVITGGDGNDTLNGGKGDDRFVMGSAADGNDHINGGLGVDTVDYSARSADITAVLDGTTASGDLGNSEADILGLDVENLWGGSGDDTLTGNASSNELVGGTGDDTLSGLGGDDTIEGGGGSEANVIDCGSGTDLGFGEGSSGTITNCEL